ncbi:uncharacterized protein LOC143038817 isoform X2 [Oratosquilla oratoria]|uniref:uncharacterized protein LOC143038817 isoform X2 n=1 Tax=Oratosquilla oratoria TaxID=337810 RepID=UPI003F76E415
MEALVGGKGVGSGDGGSDSDGSGRGTGMRSGRAVVGLDVIRHTLTKPYTSWSMPEPALNLEPMCGDSRCPGYTTENYSPESFDGNHGVYNPLMDDRLFHHESITPHEYPLFTDDHHHHPSPVIHPPPTLTEVQQHHSSSLPNYSQQFHLQRHRRPNNIMNSVQCKMQQPQHVRLCRYNSDVSMEILNDHRACRACVLPSRQGETAADDVCRICLEDGSTPSTEDFVHRPASMTRLAAPTDQTHDTSHWNNECHQWSNLDINVSLQRHHHHHPPPLEPSATSKVEHRKSHRLSRSLEDLPKDIKDHILKCKCSCNHLGYGDLLTTSLDRTPPVRSGSWKRTSKTHKLGNCGDESSSCPLSHAQRIKDGLLGGIMGGGMDMQGQQLWGVVCLVLIVAAVAGVGVSVPLALRVDPDASLHQRLQMVRSLLRETPLVDGHNDLPWNIRKFMHNKLYSFNFTGDLKNLRPWSKSSWSHTDLPRLKEGMIGAQFWVSYVPCESQYLNAVQLSIEQIDLIKRLVEQYPHDLRLATSADELEAAFRDGRIASLIGIEGGHALQNSLGTLRAMHQLGVRYLTLTHTCSTPWAECARVKETDEEDPNAPRGLTHFGKTVIREMNRLGLMVDLSHVSQATMRVALEVTKAPVIFSHSSVYAICKSPRNVPDDILQKVAENGGIVMVSFYNHFLTCSKDASVQDVIEHINHVRKIAGVDHVGIGADFDGVDRLPKGLEDVSRYPYLFAELLSDPSWNPEDLAKLAGRNLIRVMRKVEEVGSELRKKGIPPLEEEVPVSQLQDERSACSYRFVKGLDDD